MKEPVEHPSDDTLQEWAESGLEPGEAEAVSRHVGVCPACSKQAEAYRALFGELSAPAPMRPDGIYEGVMEVVRREGAVARAGYAGGLNPVWRVVGLAAAAAVVLVVLGALDLPGKAWAAFPGAFQSWDQSILALASALEWAADLALSTPAAIGSGVASLAGAGSSVAGSGPSAGCLMFLVAALAGLLNLAGILRLRRSAARSSRREE